MPNDTIEELKAFSRTAVIVEVITIASARPHQIAMYTDTKTGKLILTTIFVDVSGGPASIIRPIILGR